MADLSITASAVAAVQGATLRQRTSGDTLTQGQPIYLDTADSMKGKRTDADVAASAVCDGICLNAASSGQPVLVLVEGNLTLNAVLTTGVGYYVSATAGSICLYSDLASGDYVQYIGTATSTTNLEVNIQPTVVAKP